MRTTDKQYWESRGRRGYNYRGEELYQIGPPANYVFRRKWLLEQILIRLRPHSPRTILDFGGGDGWWAIRLATDLGCHVSCYEPAEAMLRRADSTVELDVIFSTSLDELREDFDAAICISVLAAVADADLPSVVESFASRLPRLGTALVFETAGTSQSSGATWTRRTEATYQALFARHNLRVREVIRFQRGLYFFAIESLLDPIRHRCFDGDAHRMYRLKLFQIIDAGLYRALARWSAPKHSRQRNEWNALFVLEKTLDGAGQ